MEEQQCCCTARVMMGQHCNCNDLKIRTIKTGTACQSCKCEFLLVKDQVRFYTTDKIFFYIQLRREVACKNQGVNCGVSYCITIFENTAFIQIFVAEDLTVIGRKFQMEIMHTCSAINVKYCSSQPCSCSFLTRACLSLHWFQRMCIDLEHLVTDTFSSATDLLCDLGENIFLLSLSFPFFFFFNLIYLDYKTVSTK